MRHVKRVAVLGLAIAGLIGLAACSQQQSDTAASTPSIAERRIALTPAEVTVKTSVLTGEFADLRVYQRVEEESGKVVEPPKLRGSLKLTNASADQGARPLAGQVSYLDDAGQPIGLAEGRGEATFTFPYYQDRLDPGATVTTSLDVPFPAAVLNGKRLGEVRLELSYIPVPIREETMSLKVAVSGTPQ